MENFLSGAVFISLGLLLCAGSFFLNKRQMSGAAAVASTFAQAIGWPLMLVALWFLLGNRRNRNFAQDLVLDKVRQTLK